MSRRRKSLRLDIRPVLNHYGIDTEALFDIGWFSVRCPFHGDKHASGRASLEDGGAFKCHGCDVQGDAVSLIVARGDATDFASAIEFYESQLGGSVPNVRKRASGKRRRGLFDEQGDNIGGADLLSSRRRGRTGGRT